MDFDGSSKTLYCAGCAFPPEYKPRRRNDHHPWWCPRCKWYARTDALLTEEQLQAQINQLWGNIWRNDG